MTTTRLLYMLTICIRGGYMKSEDKLIIKTKKYRGNDGYKTFSIRVREEIVDNIDTISQRTGHSRNELIGILLDYAVNHCSIEE